MMEEVSSCLPSYDFKSVRVRVRVRVRVCGKMSILLVFWGQTDRRRYLLSIRICWFKSGHFKL